MWVLGGSVQTPSQDDVPAFQPISAVPPTRQRLRCPELALIEAILLDAQQRALYLSAALRRLATGRARRIDRERRRRIHAEADQLRAWCESDSHELGTLGWICDLIGLGSGDELDPQAVGKALLGILASGQAIKMHRGQNGMNGRAIRLPAERRRAA